MDGHPEVNQRRDTQALSASDKHPSRLTRLLATVQWRRKDFLIGGGGAQFETTHRVVSNLYNNL